MKRRFLKIYSILPPPGAPMGATPFLFANLKRLLIRNLCVPSFDEIHEALLEQKSFTDQFYTWPFFAPLWAPKGAKHLFSTQNCISSNRGCFLPNLVEIGQSLIFGPFWRPLVGPFLPQFFFIRKLCRPYPEDPQYQI